MSQRKLSQYQPYLKQAEFHALGATKRERGFLAANQSGKTLSAGAETAFHATGLYPDWWEGRRFDHPTTGWVSGNSSESTRDNPQRMLLGPVGEIGTGLLPKRSIITCKRARGMSDQMDYVKVRHVSGTESLVKFKAYEQGRDKWQGATLDYVWFDEEPPEDIYDEGLTRTNHGDNGKGGIAYISATPLLGMTNVMRRFYPEPDTRDRALVMMTIDDVGHYTDEQRRIIVDAYRPHEREARAKGIPSLGSGKVFPVQEAMLEQEIFQIPAHFHQIIGCDFGWDHPTAFVHCAIDRDSGTFYVINVYKQSEEVPAVHASAVKPWGASIPVAWPHDGYQHDKSSGAEIASSYRNEGLNMMFEHATHAAGGFGVEAGVQEMFQAMRTGKFKVFTHLTQWWEEFRMYHREKGQIVKKYDDLMSATRMAWMMQRYARQKHVQFFPETVNTYDPLAQSSYVQ